MQGSTLQDTSSAAIRQSFLDYFSERGHKSVPSSPVFPKDDPTLLFTNAGMNQFKDVFLGTGKRDYRRAVDAQKCIRVQGKHNDLEEVGVDTYHHTFFEMLGNWSFGDYFKEDAITWAWEILTEVWGMPKERLWVTVFAGDEKDGLEPDVEAEALWRNNTDIDPGHILRFDRKDNFWEMGDTGPCGPCTEIHLDRGGPDSDPTDGADLKIGVNAGNERFIELWNLVFMQFNRMDDGSLVDLPAKHVDTGMGFERVLGVLQGKLSNYDTDLFQPIFRVLEKLSGKVYGQGDAETDIAMRVCGDHVRAVTVALSDGALPSNEGRGYVLRRLIRRASRYGLQNLELKEPFLFELVDVVASILGKAYPEIAQRTEHAALVIRSEEESFRKTLDRGLVQFEKLAGKLRSGATLPGRESYELYATYGFPQDLVELLGRERGLELDSEGWEAARNDHSAASKGEGSFKQLLSAEELTGLRETDSLAYGTEQGAPAEILGEAGTGHVLSLLADQGRGERLVLDATPFYGEGGGQVGDRGRITNASGTFAFEVHDTQRVGGVVVHLGVSEGVFEAGAEVSCAVDHSHRHGVRANHTATHLLHTALREVLGDHVTQQGSYVGADRLRFDFSQPKGLKPEQIDRVEGLVNESILANHLVASTEESYDAATGRGVMALFGEKYSDMVRVVDIGGWSMELCGGTHATRSGDLGGFAILSEKAIQAGVRRIEAVAGRSAQEHFREQRALLNQAQGLLKTSAADVPERIAALQSELKDAKKSARQAAMGDVDALADKVKAGLTEADGVLWGVVSVGEIDAAGLRELSARAKSFSKDHCITLLGQFEDKVPFLVLCGGAALEKGLAAGELAKTLAGFLGGGGGGRPDAAQGQGLKPEGLNEAIAAVSARVKETLG
ncbi:MAG TPA: alanine--tRNA ligase [Planctomycetes bacterium]|nr:alanine--tRNA ligase [Planctomycetota bacterium]HIL38543.1 alanine--tRNA ligase [Planctomycetota bacterium]